MPGSSAKPQMGDSYSRALVPHSNQKNPTAKPLEVTQIFITISQSLWANSPTRGTGHTGKQTHQTAELCRHLCNITRADVCFPPALAMLGDLHFLSSLYAWKCSFIPSYVTKPCHHAPNNSYEGLAFFRWCHKTWGCTHHKHWHISLIQSSSNLWRIFMQLFIIFSER